MTTTRYLFIRTQNVGDKFSFCFPFYIYICRTMLLSKKERTQVLESPLIL